MFRLDDKIAAVIGSASGIGAAIATGLGEQGATVRCLDLDLNGAQKTADAIRASGGRGDAFPVDVRQSTSVDEALTDVRDEHGRLDIVVATPGINIRKPLASYTDDEYDAVVDVNLRGTFNVLRTAARLMTPQRCGNVLVVSSISSRVVEPGQVVYAGTKAAIAQMVRVLAAEVGSYGIRVNAIAPGPVETPLTTPIREDPEWLEAYASKTALHRWARPEEMVGPAIFLTSDAASYVTGAVVFADGGSVDLNPRFQGAPLDSALAGMSE